MFDIEQVAEVIEQVGKGNWQVLGYGALGAGILLGDKSTLKMCTPEGAQALSGTPAPPPTGGAALPGGRGARQANLHLCRRHL